MVSEIHIANVIELIRAKMSAKFLFKNIYRQENGEICC